MIIPFALVGFIAKFGLKRSLIALELCGCIGQLLFTMGLHIQSFNVCFIGRLFYGVSDCISVI